MPYQLPTDTDLTVLTEFIAQEMSNSTTEEFAHLCQPVRDSCELIMGALQKSAELCRSCGENTAESATQNEQITTHSDRSLTVSLPSFDHKLFFASHRAEVENILKIAREQQPLLEAECNEHGFRFGGDVVKGSYLSFLEGARSLERWGQTVLELLDAPETVRPIRVPPSSFSTTMREEVHDVSALFQSFRGEANLYFQPEVTQYDARIQRRLLIPQYFDSLRQMLRRLELELERLTKISNVLQQSQRNKPENPTAAQTNVATGEDDEFAAPARWVTFRPPLSEFRFLYESTAMYLASSIIEDEMTTVSYYRIMYDACVRDLEAAKRSIQLLPKPTTNGGAGGAVTGRSSESRAAVDPFANVSVDAPTGESNSAAANPAPPPAHALGFSSDEVLALHAVFDLFNNGRSRLLDLANDLRSDMKRKNGTHCTRLPVLVGAAPPITPPAQTGWFAAAKRLVTGAAQIVTCSTEPVGGASLYSKTSPLFPIKEQLLREIDKYAAEVEKQADGLEKVYPGLYFKSFQSRVTNATSKVFKAIESVSVVFSP